VKISNHLRKNQYLHGSSPPQSRPERNDRNKPPAERLENLDVQKTFEITDRHNAHCRRGQHEHRSATAKKPYAASRHPTPNNGQALIRISMLGAAPYGRTPPPAIKIIARIDSARRRSSQRNIDQLKPQNNPRRGSSQTIGCLSRLRQRRGPCHQTAECRIHHCGIHRRTQHPHLPAWKSDIPGIEHSRVSDSVEHPG